MAEQGIRADRAVSRRAVLGGSAVVLGGLAANAMIGPALAATGSATPPGTAAPSASTDLIRAKVRAYQTTSRTPGIAVAFHADGQDGFLNLGVANLGMRQPVTEDVVFEIGSITKTFTATLLASQLREVDPQVPVPKQLGDPVTRYLPAAVAGSALQHVTLQQLATHTSSLPRVGGGEAANHLFAGLPPSAELLRFWNAWTPPANDPIGTHWDYANVGFVALGFAVAGRTVPPRAFAYNDVLATTVTGPLGMSATATQIPANRPAAQGYAVRNGQIVPAKSEAADLKSTARDMLTWLKAQLGLLDGGIPATLGRAIATTHDVAFDGNANKPPLTFDMGLAWQIHDKQPPLPPIFGKDGATGRGGFTCFVGFVPARQLAVAVLTNLIDNTAQTSPTAEGTASKLGLDILRALASDGSATPMP